MQAVQADLLAVMPFGGIAASGGLCFEPPGEAARDAGVGDRSVADDLVLEGDGAQLVSRAGGRGEEFLHEGEVDAFEDRHRGAGDSVFAGAVGRQQRIRHDSCLHRRSLKSAAAATESGSAGVGRVIFVPQANNAIWASWVCGSPRPVANHALAS